MACGCVALFHITLNLRLGNLVFVAFAVRPTPDSILTPKLDRARELGCMLLGMSSPYTGISIHLVGGGGAAVYNYWADPVAHPWRAG